MDPITSLRTTLKLNGQSLAKPRRMVFEALQGEEPLAMHELVTRCSRIDRASVYRTIELYEKLGIVQRLQSGWKYKLELSDSFHAHHHHASCLLCGQSVVIPEDTVIEHHLRRLARGVSYRLERHQLELQGYCRTCQALLKA
jgi:Fur family ferric uptake transcriptional regulator